MSQATELVYTDKELKELEVALTDKEFAQVLLDKINELVAVVNTKDDV